MPLVTIIDGGVKISCADFPRIFFGVGKRVIIQVDGDLAGRSDDTVFEVCFSPHRERGNFYMHADIELSTMAKSRWCP